MKALYLVSFYDYSDGSLYPLVITETYEDAVRMVHIDFKEDFTLAWGENYTLEHEDGEYIVKDLTVEPSDLDPFNNVRGFYKIEHMSLYEKPDIEELEKET